MTGASGPCCTDVAVHSHDRQGYAKPGGYAYRCAFEWRRPVVKLVTAADRQPLRLVLNRYPGVVIGAPVLPPPRLALLWGRPGRIIETAAP
jgi:hypothetical protein